MSKILVADDIAENRYLLEVLLGAHGHEVLVAVNGAEALEKARSHLPDLVVTDILMPSMDGFALCREWKKDDLLTRIPFIFYTATYTDDKDRAFGLSLGADEYLIKPIEPDLLMEIIDRVLEECTENRGTSTAMETDDKAPTSQEKADEVVSAGEVCPAGRHEPPSAIQEESAYLRGHNEALIRKLEEKMAQLEESNRLLMEEVLERREAEVQLRRLSMAIENAADCVIITDVGGRIEYVNPAFERMTGISKMEAVGRRTDVMNGGQDGQRQSCPFSETLRKVILSGNSWKGHLTHKSKDGSQVELEASISSIADPVEGLNGYVSVLRDITEQKRLQQQLAQSQKMEAIGTLAGGIAHDFNNILSAIVGYTDLALYYTSPNSHLQRDLNAVLRACDRAKSLVSQILSFSRKAERERSILDMGVLVRECSRLLRASLPSTIEITTKVAEDSGMVRADPVQIQQVILNICTNAAHAMAIAGGSLQIAMRKVRLDTDSSKRYAELEPGEYQLISIGDTGCGMDRETLARIFEPFFTTKEEGQGTGLGLSVAHGIIRGHGGTIVVYSEPGQGSVFNIYLPAARGEAEDRRDPIEGPLPTGNERILFVDDEPDLVDISRQILTRLGYQVEACTSSVEALELFNKAPQAFDLIMTDQTMPRLTGLDMAARMLATRPDLPVIICTGFSVNVSEEKARELGIKQVLMKPLVIGEVARTIRAVLDDTMNSKLGLDQDR